jgi:hypothetical protein
MELLGDISHVESHFSLFENSVGVDARQVQGCAKRTICSEIILDTPDGTLGDEAQVEARFSRFGDSANLDAR